MESHRIVWRNQKPSSWAKTQRLARNMAVWHGKAASLNHWVVFRFHRDSESPLKITSSQETLLWVWLAPDFLSHSEFWLILSDVLLIFYFIFLFSLKNEEKNRRPRTNGKPRLPKRLLRPCPLGVQYRLNWLSISINGSFNFLRPWTLDNSTNLS